MASSHYGIKGTPLETAHALLTGLFSSPLELIPSTTTTTTSKHVATLEAGTHLVFGRSLLSTASARALIGSSQAEGHKAVSCSSLSNKPFLPQGNLPVGLKDCFACRRDNVHRKQG